MSAIQLLARLREAGVNLRLDETGGLVIEAAGGMSVAQTKAVAQNEGALIALLTVEALQAAEASSGGDDPYALPPDEGHEGGPATQQWEKQTREVRRGGPSPLEDIGAPPPPPEARGGEALVHPSDVLRRALAASARGGEDILSLIARHVVLPRRPPQPMTPPAPGAPPEADPGVKDAVVRLLTRLAAQGNFEVATVEIVHHLGRAGHDPIPVVDALRALEAGGALQESEGDRAGYWRLRGARKRPRKKPAAVTAADTPYCSASLAQVETLEAALRVDGPVFVRLSEVDEVVCVAPPGAFIDNPVRGEHQARVVYWHDEWECVVNACVYGRLSPDSLAAMNRGKRKSGGRFSVSAFLQGLPAAEPPNPEGSD